MRTVESDAQDGPTRKAESTGGALGLATPMVYFLQQALDQDRWPLKPLGKPGA